MCPILRNLFWPRLQNDVRCFSPPRSLGDGACCTAVLVWSSSHGEHWDALGDARRYSRADCGGHERVCDQSTG